MITSPARGADRVEGASEPPPSALSTSTALVVLLLVALALRLTIAYILFPASGFASDVSTYVFWANAMAEHGPGGFYGALRAADQFVDYPPGYLYVLWLIGGLGQALGGSDPYGLMTVLVKVPPMLVDIAVGWLLYRLVLGWAWPSRRAEPLALGAAALYVFNPVTWYDSALWGQTDSVGALVVLMGVAALIRGNSEGASLLGVVAALVKPQFGVVLLPVIAVVLLRRHLLRPGSGPRHAPWGPSMLQGWLAREQGPLRVFSSAAVALVTFHVVALPFGMGIPDYLAMMGDTAAGYAYLTVNAYNPWALVSATGTTPLAFSMPLWQSDAEPWIGPLPPVAIGAVLLVAGFLYGLGNLLWRDERRTIILTAVFLSICFFVLPTRVHERYLVPVFALLPLLAVASRAWLVTLVAMAAACLINLHGVLTYDIWGTDNVTGLPLGNASRSPLFVVMSVLLVTGGFLFTAWRLWRGGAREPDGLAIESATVDGWVDPGPLPGQTRTSWWARGIGGSVAVPDAEDGYPEPVRGPGAFTWIAHRITPRPLRRDRSPSLAGEPPGRLDRMDLLMVVMILLSAVTLRGFRVQEPYDMYFDEVYHARTAMEFLQDWRYDDPHDIFEWTHPHLAKYAMAIGIEVFGDHRVTGTSDLGVPVAAAAIEPHWSPSGDPGRRNGDRVYVLTGSSLEVFDLATRGRLASLSSPATALAVDPGAHQLVLAAPDGTVSTLDTTLLDAMGRTHMDLDESYIAPISPVQQATDGPRDPVRLVVDDSDVVIFGATGELVSVDLETGLRQGSTTLSEVRDLEVVPRATAVVARPAEVEDPAGAARVLADELGMSAATLESLLRRSTPDVVLLGWPDSLAEDVVRELVDDGTLLGIDIEDVPAIAVATPDGVTFLATRTLDTLHELPLDDGAAGLAWIPDGPDEDTLYVASGAVLERIGLDRGAPRVSDSMDMPGPVTDVLWNEAAQLLHVPGRLAGGQPTVYVVEPHGHSVFMDVPLPFEPVATLMDTQEDHPSEDRTQILAIGNDGSVASVDVGGNAFGYRMPGVLMGALTVAGIYLLARLLFRRRSVGLFAAALALAEGMLFANARIAMNDVYITGFLVLAAVLFAPVWLGTWRRWWQVTLVVPLVGVLLGLALASKWVAAYAIGGVVLLVLLRSGIGRWIALGGMVGLTGVLGALAIRPAAVEEPHRNWPFLLILGALTLALAAAMVRRPLPVTRAQVWSAVTWLVIGGVFALGVWALAFLGAPDEEARPGVRTLVIGGAPILGASVLGIVALVLGWLGHGPFRPDADDRPLTPTDPSTPAWLDPGRGRGLWWVLAMGCLVVIPVAVYVAGYLPWAALGNQLWEGFPAGHTGKTLWGLTLDMYGYHDDLRVPHAASSPWWAWPLDLKPVWFYQSSFAGNTLGEIYDAGNLVVLWMGIPALVFGTIAAWKRRSLPVTLVVLLFLAMWLPWARIDRATFQYHYYTAIPFLVLALAYLLAELWHGPARIGWLIARVGAALCILGAPLLWLLRQPLCIAADVRSVQPNSQACGAATRDVTLSAQSLGILAVLVVAAVGVSVFLWHSSRTPGTADVDDDATDDVATSRTDQLGRRFDGLMDGPGAGLVVIGAATILALLAAVGLLSDTDRLTFAVTADELSILALLVLLAPAWLVLRARDARRFALGVVISAFLFLLVWYPNLTGLPLPSGLATAFQGLLPTWNYDFQFGVNRDPPVPGGFVDLATVVVAVVTLVLAGVVMLLAQRWRSGHPHPLLDDLR
ncbi:MAG: phospholipid carrier-dependent glycosyltransferase [Chloroflexi bacterium]|nr:phospholipid carrier-dependent glycosyltransferase [Chloroflexota bacterium]